MAILAQACKWPGVVSVASVTYTCSHGISPGTVILTTYPQQGQIATSGDLVIGDGTNLVTLRDCRVSRLRGDGGAQGQSWTLEIQDRRWRWPGLASISGSYNQLDNRGKLIPWTIRSPVELAQLCIAAMGEKGAKIILPDGLPARLVPTLTSSFGRVRTSHSRSPTRRYGGTTRRRPRRSRRWLTSTDAGSSTSRTSTASW